MHRLLVVVVVVAVAGCRMNFDPVDDEVLASAPDAGSISQAPASGSGCPAGATCITAFPGQELYTSCPAGRACQIDCTAATSCVVDCTTAAACDIVCSSRGCVVTGCVASTCAVDCGAGEPFVEGATKACL